MSEYLRSKGTIEGDVKLDLTSFLQMYDKLEDNVKLLDKYSVKSQELEKKLQDNDKQLLQDALTAIFQSFAELVHYHVLTVDTSNRARITTTTMGDETVLEFIIKRVNRLLIGYEVKVTIKYNTEQQPVVTVLMVNKEAVRT